MPKSATIEKGKTYLAPGQTAPQGAKVQQGARGGKYYEEGAGGKESTPKEKPEAKTEAKPKRNEKAPPGKISFNKLNRLFDEGKLSEEEFKLLSSGENVHHNEKDTQSEGSKESPKSWGYDEGSKTESEDFNGDKVGVGSKVKVHPELTTDPADHKGDEGIVVGVNKDGDVLIEFNEGKKYGAYTPDSVIGEGGDESQGLSRKKEQELRQQHPQSYDALEAAQAIVKNPRMASETVGSIAEKYYNPALKTAMEYTTNEKEKEILQDAIAMNDKEDSNNPESDKKPKTEAPNGKHWADKSNHGKDPRLKEVNESDLDPIESKQLKDMTAKGTERNDALQVIINSSEGDSSQLSDQLADIGEAQDSEVKEENKKPEDSSGFNFKNIKSKLKEINSLVTGKELIDAASVASKLSQETGSKGPIEMDDLSAHLKSIASKEGPLTGNAISFVRNYIKDIEGWISRKESSNKNKSMDTNIMKELLKPASKQNI